MMENKNLYFKSHFQMVPIKLIIPAMYTINMHFTHHVACYFQLSAFKHTYNILCFCQASSKTPIKFTHVIKMLSFNYAPTLSPQLHSRPSQKSIFAPFFFQASRENKDARKKWKTRICTPFFIFQKRSLFIFIQKEKSRRKMEHYRQV